MANPPFRVIIVGAGPVGLYMAHAMERAEIEYVVVEKNSTVLNPSGQLLFTWPQTVRLFDQLGIYKELSSVALPMHYKKRVYGHDGRVTSTNRFWDFMERSHGYPFLPMLRSDLVAILFHSLKGRNANVHTSTEVVGIESTANGVRVHARSGLAVEGSVVVGADGVHSKTSVLMRELANDSTAGQMISSFYGIFGRASIHDLPIEPEVFFESRGAGAVIQCLGTTETLQFVALKPLEEPSAARRKYTRQEMEDYAKSIGDVALCPGIRFKDVWKKARKDETTMLNQEEGFTSRWFHGRIVLVGDAVHKSTSVNGLGMTCGLHSAAVLANGLHQAVSSATADESPSVERLEQCFARYQQDREAEVKPIWAAGYSMIREVTRQSWLSWFWDSYVLPWIDIERLGWGIVPSVFLVRQGHILAYVPFLGREGIIPWVRRPLAHQKLGG
ncbi:hypothetical protein F5Y14DRAFT_462820 [Nemania sp. NC0429]|nr:hypothetical protein F5Y14DRAFT_462820 [Nemania sp. NC0429]